MSFEHSTTYGTFTDFSPPKHKCRIPYYAEEWPPHDPKNRPTHWTCNDCGQVYSIEYTGWTGWWSPDTDFDTEEGTDEHGHPVIRCMWETWVDCPPTVTFVPRKPNNLGCSGYGSADPFPGNRPEWLPPLPVNRRPYVSAKNHTRVFNKSTSSGRGGLSQLVDSTSGESHDASKSQDKKRRPWLLRG